MGISGFLTLLTVLLLSFNTFSQIIFKNNPDYRINIKDSSFFEVNSRRNIIPLNGGWDVYSSNEKENREKIVIPSVFTGEGELIFQRALSFTKEQLAASKMEIHFFGLNYTADISVNENIIYRHPGGEYPFKIDLPKDILNPDKKNTLSVKLNYRLDSENTIPVKQRFMFPQNYGGILKDVFIKITPNISIADVDITYNYVPQRNAASFRIISRVQNKDFRKDADTTEKNNLFTYRVRFDAPGNGQSTELNDVSINLPVNADREIEQGAEIFAPVLWSPSSPGYYTVYFELYKDNELIDRTTRRVSVYSLVAARDSLILNNQPFKMNGVTYIPSFYGYGSLYSYDQMARDIKIIKEAGFNVVRFAKSVPHPYLLDRCEKEGILALVEIPVNFVPPGLLDDINFMTRSKGFLSNLVKAFKDHTIIAAFGIGSSLLPELEGHRAYINDMTSFLKGRGKKVYASFAGINLMEFQGLDFYGIELFNTPVSEINNELTLLQEKFGAGHVFISSATYVVNAGNTNGYINDYSFEAQAKYFEDLIDYTQRTRLSGYFINSMFDYRGDYTSLIAGYNDERLYRIGVLGENRDKDDRIGYKIIYAKLNNSEVPTIPIGSKRDSSPMIFILFGLAIALLIGVLINSGKKFREDASRALLRPYNFYADVRDQRIMSGYQATLLALIISAISALLLSNLLFYLRQDVKFEKFLLAFGSKGIIDTASYLAWNPGLALFWFSAASLAALIIITILVKLASFFVRNRVYFSGIYYVVIWSFLPLVLLIPVGIILFRILDADFTNMYIFLGLLLFTIWILYRLMKGIYVIFDVNPGSVYFYSFVFILVVLGGFIIYYEIHSSVISYFTLTIKQYKFFG